MIVFLGAGVSIASGLPTAAELTARVFEPSAGEDVSVAALRRFLEILRDYDTADIARSGPFKSGFASGAVFRGKASTYEDLFFLCQELSLWSFGQNDNALTTPFLEALARECGAFLHAHDLPSRLHELALYGRPGCEFIETVATRALTRPYVTGLERLVELVRAARSNIFIATLNHDTLVEQVLHSEGLPYRDGFGPTDGDVRWSDDDAYDVPGGGPRLLKLHGSVDWYQFQHDGRSRTAMLRGDDVLRAKNAAGGSLESNSPRPRFLSGLGKAVEYNTGIFSDIHYRFLFSLRATRHMVMCGYGWGDTAISLQLEAWLNRSSHNRLVLLHPDFDQLVEHSFVMARSQRAWQASGQLRIIPHWLSDVSMSELQRMLA